MMYTFARVSAAIGMNVEDYYAQGSRWWVRLHEKGGKRHEMPAHHVLETYMDEYLAAGGLGRGQARSPLPHRLRQNRPAHRLGACTAPMPAHDPPPGARGRHRNRARLPRLPRDRHHRLPQEWRAPRARAADGRA